MTEPKNWPTRSPKPSLTRLGQPKVSLRRGVKDSMVRVKIVEEYPAERRMSTPMLVFRPRRIWAIGQHTSISENFVNRATFFMPLAPSIQLDEPLFPMSELCR